MRRCLCNTASFFSQSPLMWQLRDNSEETNEEDEQFYDSFAVMNLDEFSLESSLELIAPPVSSARTLPASSDSSDPGCGNLLPQLPNSILRGYVWAKLMRMNPISMLQRLRRVNQAWKQMVESTVEWSALEFTRLDAPGYHCYATEQARRWWVRFRKCDRKERFVNEMKHIQSILEEPRYPMYNLVWCVGDESNQVPLEFGNSELRYYSQIAMEVSM